MKGLLRYCLLLVLMLTTGGVLKAQTIVSAGTGNWSDPATWVGGVVPVSGNNVTINFSHVVTLTAAVDIGSGVLDVNGTLALAGFDMTAGALVGSGSGAIGTASGTPTLTVGSNNTNDIWNGVYSGTGARFTKVGTGSFFFNGTNPNTYTGATTISAGRVQIATNNERISNSTDLFVASGAVFDLGGRTETVGSLAGAGTVRSGFSGGVLILSGNASTTFSGVIENGAGNMSLTKEGAGILTISGANTYTGATTINAGTLRLGSASERISNSSALTIATGAIFDMNGVSETVFSFGGDGTITSSAAGSVTITHGGGNASSTFSGVIQNGSGTVALNKPLTGTLTLTGNNTYTGGTSVSNGTIQIGNGGTSGSVVGNITTGSFGGVSFNRSDDFTFPGNIGTGSGASVRKQGAGTMTLTGSITVSSITVQGGILSIGNGGTTGSVTSNINVANTAAAVVFNRSDNITYSGAITNTGSVTKLGAGTLTLSGASSYSGATTISSGILRLSGASERISNSSALNVASGATFDLGGQSETVASIAGAGTITSSAGGAVIIAHAGNASTTFSGIIQNGSGTVGLTKIGTGTLTLSGANAYTGATTVSGGTLIASNGHALGASTAVTVNTGATLQTNASLSIPGSLSIDGRMNCNGFNSECLQLSLGGVAQTTLGTYGSTASTATFQNNTYFTAASAGFLALVSVLPVTWLDFTGQIDAEKVVLNWKTASEQNNTGFDIERSTDGRAWSKIGFIPGKINSAVLTHYNYTDLSPLKGLSYYRLRQIDLDGKFTYSRVVRINNVNNGEVAIWPNPVTDLMNVEINQRYRNQKVYITVTDMKGTVLVSRIVTHGNSAISTSGWSKGLYVVTLKSEDDVMMTRKILKQ